MRREGAEHAYESLRQLRAPRGRVAAHTSGISHRPTVRQAEVGDAPLPYAVWTFGSLVIEDSQGFQDLLLLQGPAAYEIGQTLSPA